MPITEVVVVKIPILSRPPWWLTPLTDVEKIPGRKFKSTQLGVYRMRGKIGSCAPREWFRTRTGHLFVHDVANMFASNSEYTSFPDAVRQYLVNNPGPPGILSGDEDLYTQIFTLDAFDFFGSNPISLRLDRHEDWWDTVKMRLYENEINNEFTGWR